MVRDRQKKAVFVVSILGSTMWFRLFQRQCIRGVLSAIFILLTWTAWSFSQLELESIYLSSIVSKAEIPWLAEPSSPFIIENVLRVDRTATTAKPMFQDHQGQNIQARPSTNNTTMIELDPKKTPTNTTSPLKNIPTQASQKQRMTPVLEFVHIPKTGGSAIEKAAAEVNITWGACHFNHSMRVQMKCPIPDFQSPMMRPERHPPFTNVRSLWHVPPHKWTKNHFANSSTFCVIRNPYTRALSAYYDRFAGYKGPNDINNQTLMNQFIQDRIENHANSTLWMPQWKFIFDDDGEQVVDHILRFERLKEEFTKLMHDYNLSHVILGDKKFNHRTKGTLLGLQQFSPTTIQRLRDHFHEDFERLNYSLILPITTKVTPSATKR